MDDVKLVNEDEIGMKILDAAIRIIDEEGYENLKIRKVASVSGCSNSAIYTRFEDKDALCKEIAKMHAEPVYKILNEIYRPELDLLTNLYRIAHAEMEIFYAMDLDSLILQMKYRGTDVNNPFLKKIEECLYVSVRKGEIKVDSIPNTAFAIESMFWGFVFMAKTNPNFNLESIQRMLNEYLSFLYKSLNSESSIVDVWTELKSRGVNVDKALERLKGNKDTYKEFLLEFLTDPDFDYLNTSIQEGEVRKAFEFAHGLKGMAANLGLEKILESLTNLVEVLRIGSLEGAMELFEQVFETCREISELLQE